jgi:hypothetical protein
MNVANDEEFYQLVRNGIYQNINDEIEEEEPEIENEDDDDDDLVDIEEYEKFNSENDDILQSENYFNFVSQELVELLKLQEPQVIIEPINVNNVVTDHGNKNFDLDKLLDEQFNSVDDN